ncbi:glycine zipper family protein [Polaromonas sp. C04]|uniref:glycine zipper family protein n=1 Tax=Polaromonas sp. C04 TaxID=1945857 RepID=UPI0009D34046|nr:glycine zipper family protein [Polaromonas sp. C04]OOG53404.1 glycine zipper family protein [Polaromonas sp. C04]
MQTGKLSLIALPPLLWLAACASPPMGPTVQVLPSPNKPFQVFQQDQFDCKQYAQSQVAGQAEAVNRGAAGAAATGVVLGGLLGAAIGNHQGAGIGAGVGAIAGTSAGANSSAYAQGSIQAQYNNAYVQCMYSKGNQVPGARPQYPQYQQPQYPQPYQQPQYPQPYPQQ